MIRSTGSTSSFVLQPRRRIRRRPSPVASYVNSRLGVAFLVRVGRRALLLGDDLDDLIRVARAPHPHGLGLTGVLVDDVQQLQPPAVVRRSW